MTRARPPGGRSTPYAATAVLALTAALTVSACGAPPAGPPVSRVERGEVALKVSASGALSSVNSQNLGFRTGARLTGLNVRVGDTVTPGEVLAKLDDFRVKNALDVAQDARDVARASYLAVLRGVTVSNARKLYDESKRSYEKVKKSVAALIEAARDAERRASVKYGYDLRQLIIANDRLRNARTTATMDMPSRPAHCDTSQTDPSNLNDSSRRPDYIPPPPPPPTMSSMTPTTTAAAPMVAAPPGGIDPTGGTGSGGTTAPGSQLTQALGGSGSGSSPMAENAACNTPRATALMALQTAFTSKAAYVAARNATIVARRGGDVTIQAARISAITNETLLRAIQVGRPYQLDGLRAALDGLEAGLRNAQQDLRDTVLIAPVGGTVSAINGVIGEYIGQGSGVTAQAPGNNAPIPGVGAAASSDQAGNAASGISATKPGGNAFIVLNNVNTFQVVVPFEETDATKIRPNQQVDVTFDSVPDLDVPGTVLSIAPNGVNISGVTNYYATVLLSRSDPRLKSGITAEAGVLTNAVNDTLMVPNSAISKRDGRSYVTVAGPNGTSQQKEFQPGLVGSDTTQVISGLNEGDQLLPPPKPGAG